MEWEVKNENVTVHAAITPPIDTYRTVTFMSLPMEV